MKIKIHRVGELITAHPMAEVDWKHDFPPTQEAVSVKGFPGQMDYVSIGNQYQLTVVGYDRVATALGMCTGTKDGYMERKVDFRIDGGWKLKDPYGSSDEAEDPVPHESYRRAPADW